MTLHKHVLRFLAGFVMPPGVTKLECAIALAQGWQNVWVPMLHQRLVDLTTVDMLVVCGMTFLGAVWCLAASQSAKSKAVAAGLVLGCFVAGYVLATFSYRIS